MTIEQIRPTPAQSAPEEQSNRTDQPKSKCYKSECESHDTGFSCDNCGRVFCSKHSGCAFSCDRCGCDCYDIFD